MSTRIVWDSIDDVAVLYDSVSGIAFGQIFTAPEAYENAENFLAFLTGKNVDARAVQSNTLQELRREFEAAA